MWNGRREHIVRIKSVTVETYWYARHVGAVFVVLDAPLGEPYMLKVDAEHDETSKRYIMKNDCVVLGSG